MAERSSIMELEDFLKHTGEMLKRDRAEAKKSQKLDRAESDRRHGETGAEFAKVVRQLSTINETLIRREVRDEALGERLDRIEETAEDLREDLAGHGIRLRAVETKQIKNEGPWKVRVAVVGVIAAVVAAAGAVIGALVAGYFKLFP